MADEPKQISIDAPKTGMGYAFFAHGLGVAMMSIVRELAEAAPDRLEPAKLSAIAAIKACWGEQGTTIEDEASGLGVAINSVNAIFALEEGRIRKMDE